MVGVPHGEGVAGAGAGVAVQLPVLGAAGAQAAGGAVRGGGGGAEVAEVRGLARHGAEVTRSRGRHNTLWCTQTAAVCCVTRVTIIVTALTAFSRDMSLDTVDTGICNVTLLLDLCWTQQLGI